MASQTVLITGARAPAALEWARQFAGVGWRVLAADSMPRPLASWSRSVARTWRVPPVRHEPAGFIHAVAGICAEEGVGLIMPVCEEIFELSRGAEQMPGGTRLWAESFDRLRKLHDKKAFMEWAGHLGLPVPETHLITAVHEVRARSGDWFLKPCFSRFAVAGRRWNREADGASAAAAAWLSRQEISPVRPWVAQEFLVGQGWCAYALAESGRVLHMVCYPVEWTAGAGACVAFTATSHQAVEHWVSRFIGAAGLTGQMAFDFVEVPGRGVLPLECNPRATSGIHLSPQAAHLLTLGFDRNHGSINSAGGGRSLVQEPVPAMLTVPMLLYGLPHAVARGRAAAWLRTWRTAREVASAPGDTAPAWLGNAWTLAWFAMEARRLRCGLTAATTADLEWNGDSNLS